MSGAGSHQSQHMILFTWGRPRSSSWTPFSWASPLSSFSWSVSGGNANTPSPEAQTRNWLCDLRLLLQGFSRVGLLRSYFQDPFYHTSCTWWARHKRGNCTKGVQRKARGEDASPRFLFCSLCSISFKLPLTPGLGLSVNSHGKTSQILCPLLQSLSAHTAFLWMLNYA